MKANPINAFLEECRTAKTADEFSRVCERIDQKIEALKIERATFSVQLQEAIADGVDPGKLHAAVGQINENVQNLEAALTVYKRRHEEAATAEYNAETQALIDRLAVEGQEVTAAASEMSSDLVKSRVSCAKLAGATKQHDRTRAHLEARKVRPGLPASAITRNAIGDVPRGDGVSEYGRRMDVMLAEILAMNPGQLMRARDARRQGGRFGETYAAQDHAVEAIMGQVRNAKAG